MFVIFLFEKVNPMARKGYTTVALPNVLLDQIEELVKDKRFGYISKPEFIKEACRKMLNQLRNERK